MRKAVPALEGLAATGRKRHRGNSKTVTGSTEPSRNTEERCPSQTKGPAPAREKAPEEGTSLRRLWKDKPALSALTAGFRVLKDLASSCRIYAAPTTCQALCQGLGAGAGVVVSGGLLPALTSLGGVERDSRGPGFKVP